MKYRFATPDDIQLLARMNMELADEEQHPNRLKSEGWFRDRMGQFFESGYKSVLFEMEEKIVAYALYRNDPERYDTIYLRQMFVVPEKRRGGVGKKVIGILNGEIWPGTKRLTVEVLCHNEIALKFFQSVGYKIYSLELEMKPEARDLSQSN